MNPSSRTLLSAPTALSASRILGANDRVRIGIVGTGGRGSHLMREANKSPNVQRVAVCDAWDRRRDQALTPTGAGVEKYADYRALLNRKDIDGVIVATWDNTHAQISLDACQAGKDVFVE